MTTYPALKVNGLAGRGKNVGLLWLALTLVAASVAALVCDGPLAYVMSRLDLPGDLRKMILMGEVFAHGGPIAVIFVGIYFLDPSRRRLLPRAIVAVYGAGVATNVVKSLVARWRPGHFDDYLHDGAFISGWETFAGFLPFARVERWGGEWTSDIQSFPSGHVTTAMALAIVLTRFYPHGRWFFAGLVPWAAIQRLFVAAHFASDTLFGAALACVFVHCVLHAGPMARAFDRWEAGPQEPTILTLPVKEKRHSAAPDDDAADRRRAA